jgi:hypothetical protein
VSEYQASRGQNHDTKELMEPKVLSKKKKEKKRKKLGYS